MIRFKTSRRTLGRWFIYGILSLVFLLFHSEATSPLFNYWGGDSAFFILVGQGMTKGLLPYRDFFDMKGPYLFLIEYIGQLICYGSMGAFFIQWINLFLSLCIISRILRLMCRKDVVAFPWELLGILGCLFIGSFTFDYGNCTEEYSLPWLLLSLYFALKYFKSNEQSGDYTHPLKFGFYHGFAFGVLALIRITNAAIIGAVILTISIGLLHKKEFKNLFYNGLVFILGCAVAFAPMCIYFACYGLLGEMLSQVFVFGVKYSAEVSFADKLLRFRNSYRRFLLWMGLALGPLVIYRSRKVCYWLLAFSTLVLSFIAVNMGNSYMHYFTLAIPNLVLGLAIALEQGTKQTGDSKPLRIAQRSLCGAFILTVFILQIPFFRTKLEHAQGLVAFNASLSHQDDSITEIVDLIPQQERNSIYVYGLNSCSNWYVRAGLFPAHRYCDWQEHYIELVPEIGNELESWLRDGGPIWVVTPTDIEIAPTQIRDAINDCYHIYEKNGSYTLYQFNDISGR